MEIDENANNFYKRFSKHVLLIHQNSIHYNTMLANSGLPTQAQKNNLGFSKIAYLACHF